MKRNLPSEVGFSPISKRRIRNPSGPKESLRVRRTTNHGPTPQVTNGELLDRGPAPLGELRHPLRTHQGTRHPPLASSEWTAHSSLLLCFYSRCNISYLEEWLKDKNLQKSLAKETLEPLSQAAWLLQVKKTTDSDAREIYERCTSLSAVQVIRLAERLPDLHRPMLPFLA